MPQKVNIDYTELSFGMNLIGGLMGERWGEESGDSFDFASEVSAEVVTNRQGGAGAEFQIVNSTRFLHRTAIKKSFATPF